MDSDPMGIPTDTGPPSRIVFGSVLEVIGDEVSRLGGSRMLLLAGPRLESLVTTYAGSEVTPVLGETAQGVKTTHSSPAVLPETVIYDVDRPTTRPRHRRPCSASQMPWE